MPALDVAAGSSYLYSIYNNVGDGSQTTWEISFAGGYINRNHVKGLIARPDGSSDVLSFTWVGDNTINISPAVPAGVDFTIYRDTPKDRAIADFSDGAVVSEYNLDTNADQAVFIAAEAIDRQVLTEARLSAEHTALAARTLKFLPGQSATELNKADFVGKFLVGDALGNFVPSTGTAGADAALRGDLSDDGLDIVGDSGTSLRQIISEINSAVGVVASGSALYAGVSALAVVAAVSVANLANPAIADLAAPGDLAPAIGTTVANQANRVRNQITGVLSEVSPSNLAVSRKYAVTQLLTYTASLHNAPLDWTFYTNGFMQFYNADGSFHSTITTGFTLSADGRQLTFTVPAGAALWAVNFQHVGRTTSNPITDTDMALCHSNLMLNTGASAEQFAPYTSTPFTPSLARFVGSATKPIRLTRQGDIMFVRTVAQASDTEDLVQRVRCGHGLNYARAESRTGVIDLYGSRFIPRASPFTASAFNTSVLLQTAGVDESCPEHRNGMFVDAGHGGTCFKVTAVGHSLTLVDVGSLWSDGTRQWQLLYIEPANVLVFQLRWTGTLSKWAIPPTPPASATFTHVFGATHTGSVNFTSPEQAQFVPIVTDYLYRVVVDDVVVEADGDYSGDSVWIEEAYTGLNLARVQEALLASVGTATPDWTPDGVGQSRVYNRYEWNTWGAITIYSARFIVEAFSRMPLEDYWGGIQLQRLSLFNDSRPGMHDAVELYIPDIGTVAGKNWRAKADITANTDVINLSATSCDNPGDPSSLFIMLGKKLGAYVSGLAFGYDPEVGLGEPSQRAASTDYVLTVAPTEKMYPKAIDARAGDGVSGQTFDVACFRGSWRNTDPDLTVPGFVYTVNGVHRVIVAAHQVLANKDVRVPREFSGKAVTIIHGSGVVLDNGDTGYVHEGKISISVPSGHGCVTLRIG